MNYCTTGFYPSTHKATLNKITQAYWKWNDSKVEENCT